MKRFGEHLTPWQPRKAVDVGVGAGSGPRSDDLQPSRSDGLVMVARAGRAPRASPRCWMRPAARWRIFRPGHRRADAVGQPAFPVAQSTLIGFAQAGGRASSTMAAFRLAAGGMRSRCPRSTTPTPTRSRSAASPWSRCFATGPCHRLTAAPIRRGDRVGGAHAGRRGHGQTTGTPFRTTDRTAQPQPGASGLRLRSGGGRLDPPGRVGQPMSDVQAPGTQICNQEYPQESTVTARRPIRCDDNPNRRPMALA